MENENKLKISKTYMSILTSQQSGNTWDVILKIKTHIYKEEVAKSTIYNWLAKDFIAV